jgi:subtilisin family serine protease
MACKFLGPNGGLSSDAITCIDYAVAKGARILNNSWGGTGYSQALSDAINAAGQKGVLFVAAAGNDGLNNDLSPHYPASYGLGNIISVAALDRNDSLANFSDFGGATVHIGAPGVEIFSCFNGSDTDYAVLDGTSMATPHVSGVAALLLSVYPTAKLSELRQRILLGAVPIPALNGRTNRCAT